MCKWCTHEEAHRLACGTVKNIVKVQVCNLRLIDNIEQKGHSDANIEWSSDKTWTDSLALKLLSNFIFFLNFFEVYSKCLELHNYMGQSAKHFQAFSRPIFRQRAILIQRLKQFCRCLTVRPVASVLGVVTCKINQNISRTILEKSIYENVNVFTRRCGHDVRQLPALKFLVVGFGFLDGTLLSLQLPSSSAVSTEN